MTQPPTQDCPLCQRRSAWLTASDAEIQHYSYKCTNCGDFTLVREFSRGFSNDDRRIVRGISVERHIRGLASVRVDSETIEMLRLQAPADPAYAADRFLVNLAHKSSEPGMMTHLNVEMARGMAFTDALDSVYANLSFLQAAGWIEYQGDRTRQDETAFRLTLAGWERVRKLRAESHASDSAFVAMSFDDSFDALYDQAIAPAIIEAGWRPIRADKEHHTARIDDWIMNQISAAKFVIVDTTTENSGALFETGVALGLNRPVIWTVEEQWMKKGLHFDLRQYNHLKWTKGREAELASPLAERIIAAVGRGPLR